MGKTPRRFQVHPPHPSLRIYTSSGNDSSAYTLEIVAEITGVESQTNLFYQEQGLISPPDSGEFDDEAVRTLRRIVHLRRTCEANLAGLKLILALTDEVERLRSAVRARR